MLVAAALSAPNPGVVALAQVRFEDYAEPLVRRAAVLLELARGGLTAARAVELAAMTQELAESNANLVSEVAKIIENYERFDESSERYLLELRSRLQGDDWKDMRAVLDTLENSFRRRTSGLADRDVWRSLALPEGLLTGTG